MVMNKLLQEAEEIALNLEHLQCLGAMHIAAILDKKVGSDYNFHRKYSGREDIQIIINVGSPADFAFTIFILVDSVSNFIKRNGEYYFALIVTLLTFENFAYKLRGAKRVAFIAMLCASLHYDVDPPPNETFRLNQLKTMVDYALNNFGVGSKAGMSEVRIYLTFTSLIMADVFKQIQNDDANCLEYIKKANLKRNFDDFKWFGLCQFLIRYFKVIENDLMGQEMTDPLLNYAVIKFPDWKFRCRKAICAYRFSRTPCMFSAIWMNRLGNAF